MAAIGFIGASGSMGHGMAKNLLVSGHPLSLTVHRNRERVAVIPTLVGEAVHPSLVIARALGQGKKFVLSLVQAQEQLTGAKLVP